MRRLVIVFVLIAVAGVAGLVRSHTRGRTSLSCLPQAISGNSTSEADVKEEIRKNVELASGAQVHVFGINGSVKIETADVKTAEVFVERFAKSRESLSRREVVVNTSANNLEIRGKHGDVGFFARLFGSNPTERVTLKVPRDINVTTEGVNGAVTIGDVAGSVSIHGVNGNVEVAQADGAVEFHGINGNITVGLKQIQADQVSIHGINGNIELRLAQGLNAELDAHGMNGSVVSDLPDFVLDRAKHGSYTAHVGSGGSSISASGINGNIRLSRSGSVASVAEAINSPEGQ